MSDTTGVVTIAGILLFKLFVKNKNCLGIFTLLLILFIMSSGLVFIDQLNETMESDELSHQTNFETEVTSEGVQVPTFYAWGSAAIYVNFTIDDDNGLNFDFLLTKKINVGNIELSTNIKPVNIDYDSSQLTYNELCQCYEIDSLLKGGSGVLEIPVCAYYEYSSEDGELSKIQIPVMWYLHITYVESFEYDFQVCR